MWDTASNSDSADFANEPTVNHRSVNVVPLNRGVSRNTREEGGSTREDENPLIPEGEYELSYVDYSTLMVFKTPKVLVRFKVVTFGEHFGKILHLWYRVNQLKGRPKKRGGFLARPTSRCFREFCGLFPTHTRADRISYQRLINKVVVGRVRVVEKDYEQGEIPTAARYSIVGALVRLAR